MRTTLSLWALVVLSMGCSSGEIADGSTDGAEIFKQACARCHGGDGVPNKGLAARTGVKALTSERVRKSLSDEDLRSIILNGSKSRSMPPFQGALKEEQLTAVVAHIRYLGTLAKPSPKPKP